MSLFVGNVSKMIEPREIEAAFKKHGNCRIDFRNRYAFVEYVSHSAAEKALHQLQNKNYGGLKLNIQWSRNSGRFNENKQNTFRERSRDRERSPVWGTRRDSPIYESRDFKQPECARDYAVLKFVKEYKSRGEERGHERKGKRREQYAKQQPESDSPQENGQIPDE